MNLKIKVLAGLAIVYGVYKYATSSKLLTEEIPQENLDELNRYNVPVFPTVMRLNTRPIEGEYMPITLQTENGLFQINIQVLKIQEDLIYAISQSGDLLRFYFMIYSEDEGKNKEMASYLSQTLRRDIEGLEDLKEQANRILQNEEGLDTENNNL